jgi:hypothetical protein
MGTVIGVVLCTGLLLVLVSLAIREHRHAQEVQSRIRAIKQSDPNAVCLSSAGQRFQAVELNASPSPWRRFVVAVTLGQVAIYPPGSKTAQPVILTPDQLRWFGRPKKYHYGKNQILLHAERDGHWLLVRLWLSRIKMQTLVRALKTIVPDDLVKAYRRRRPYVHYGPVAARPATQDIHGAWTLGEPISLYLMPAYLAVLKSSAVQRTIPLDTIQQVSAIRRLDQPRAAGLVRFEVPGESVAYALDRYEAFASALAEAARRTLEDPVQWQRKKKKQDDSVDDDDDDS